MTEQVGIRKVHRCDLPQFGDRSLARMILHDNELRYCADCDTYWECTSGKWATWKRRSKRWMRRHAPEALVRDLEGKTP